MPLSQNEFDSLMDNWDEETRKILLERRNSNYSRPIKHFSKAEAVTMKALLECLVPQSEGLDLVGYVDKVIGRPLGRGDRPEGLLPENELFKEGLVAIDQASKLLMQKPFSELSLPNRSDFLRRLQSEGVSGEIWERVPFQTFLTRLLMKALTGYCSHPRVWLRMGFPGPSYPEGYVWITEAEIRQRRRHFPGWKTF